MATKKDPKAALNPANQKPDPNLVVKEQPPAEEVHPQVHNMELEGFGRFEYRNGTVYEGQWKLIRGVKMKHGEGVLIHAGLFPDLLFIKSIFLSKNILIFSICFAGTTAHEQGNEEYRGTWVEDKMNGFGVYKYTSGAIYSGEWKEGKQNGRV